MLYKLQIKVSYPLQAGRIVLRTDQDWNVDIEPGKVNADGTEHVFSLTSDLPYLYFKPCIIDQDGLHWSQGANYLGIFDDREKDVYPHFFTDLAGQVSPIISVPSTVLKEARSIRIYYPPGYRENKLKRYPVLYMHDGSNLFFPEEAFLGQDWQVDKTMELLDRMNAINKVIVVGIYSEDRMSEYTAPGYEQYGRFITTDLKPFIDHSERTLTDPENTTVMGSSLGGVVSLHLAWTYPGIFGKAACLSSTFNYRDDLFARISADEKKDIEIYLDSGWPGDNYEVSRSMRDLLARKGFTFGKDLLYFAFPNAEHNETFWATRSFIPFQFFFDKLPDFTAV